MVAGLTASREATAGAEEPATVHVAVVVDFGVRSGLMPEVFIRCLRVAAGSNGSDVLSALEATADLGAPTYAASGLLCSIDGYPTHGCGTSKGRGFAYWSYWHGGTAWTYANLGPAEWTVRNDDVEGWRFENPGNANPTDPPPSAASSYADACAAATPGVAPAPPGGHARSSTLLVAGLAVLVVLVLGSAGALRWRRRPSG